MHFSHVKACVSSPQLEDVEATISHIPYIKGHAPTEWKGVVNTMIEKKGKRNKVRDLRTLNLLEDDFNFNNKVMAKKTLECAERNGVIPPEKCGSRKGLGAISQECNKRLLYDLNHMQQRPIILCSNNAKSYYDRIFHSIASLALQRSGIPSAPIVRMLRTIQGVDHCIRTAFWRFIDYYQWKRS